MKFFHKNNDHALIVGFFQDPETATRTLKNLHRQGFHRLVALHCSTSGSVTVDARRIYTGAGALIVGAVALFIAGAVVLPSWSGIDLASIVREGWILAAFALIGALAGGFFFHRFDSCLDDALIARFRQCIVHGESVVIVKAPVPQASRALGVLRDVAGEPPVTFAFHPKYKFDLESELPLLRHEANSSERLSRQATRLAQNTMVASGLKHRNRSLLPRLRESERILQWMDSSLAMSVEVNQAFALSAEWLLDNAYLIRGQIEYIRKNLPLSYYEELPVVATGAQAGLPRVYRLATEIVDANDAEVDAETIRVFLHAFQAVSPLTIGELWSVPLMLRFRLIECLRALAIQVERLQRESEKADFWANRLITAVRRSPRQLEQLTAELVKEHPEPTAKFASELMAHLYDEEGALPIVSAWLERTMGSTLVEIIQQEHRRQTAQQTSLANAITSCRQLTHIDWPELFESVSRADEELRKDPAAVYPCMDFETRNDYRSKVEEIAKWSKISELDVIQRLLALAEAGTDEITRHVGYYLVDDGLEALEKSTGCRLPFAMRLPRWLQRHATPFYLCCVGLFTGGIVAIAVAFAALVGTGMLLRYLLGAFLVLPASELALQLVNSLVTRWLPPKVLPKMSFQKEGIPNNCRTLVVVPMLLTTPDAIRREVDRLEIRYLGNPDPNVALALLSDFADAPRQHMQEDPEYLEIVVRGINELNRRHGPNRFFLFHRQREWSECEKCWMGWERKRGKLEQVNRFLMGETAPELDDLLCVGDREHLYGIRFVITLDADTQLLRDSARRLVETLAHPLNQARLSADGRTVLRGYTIIQPLVSTSLPSATATWFSCIFADPRGIDPYTHAVSDVYQDLMGEGNYHGKGIYDLAAFHRILSGRFPESHLLSHDLIEGVHVRVALASDIELLDVFPSSYIVWWSRLHRWTRGDWQIVDWLKNKVPDGRGGVQPNPLSIFSRWKIFDNLRRSLVPASMLALLLLGWLVSPSPAMWSLIVAAFLLWPVFGRCFVSLSSWPPQNGTRFWREPIASVISAALLPDQAVLVLDAICRAVYRRRFSHQLLLEWETAQEAHRRQKNRRRGVILGMLWITACALILFAVICWFLPNAVWAAAPFLFLWALSPLIVLMLEWPVVPIRERRLSADDRQMLRRTARLTWRYFEDFVGPHTNWLPPDNYQETHKKELFLRTSPTNIGLWMLSTLAAHDFGYLTTDEVMRRHLATLDTLDKLERFEGHLLNWYDIGNLSALEPRYVSTVDSGNLLACLWTLEAGCNELLSNPILGPTALCGLADTLAILHQVRPPDAQSDPVYQETLLALETLTSVYPVDLEDIVYRIRSASRPAKTLLEAVMKAVPEGQTTTASGVYWAKQVEKEVDALNLVIDTYLRPLEILAAPPSQVLSISEAAHEWRLEAMAANFSLRNLVSGDIPRLTLLLSYQSRSRELNLPEPVSAWIDQLAQAVCQTQALAARQLAQAEGIICRLQKLASGMDMRFLYEKQRRLFAIGYRVGERCLDNCFYDLLASESRLASLVSIARDDVPVEHWWALGRPFGTDQGRHPLMSWTGTMFEYLMPALLTRTCDNSLLDRACRDAVNCQIAYAKKRGVPWGISESAFSALDRHHIYQYRAFGVPALGLKRGLDRDLVIAPYATALSLAINPAAAIKNLRRLASLEDVAMIGDYGYYEAIDYSRQRGPKGIPGIVVHCYMVHHQGMSLLAFDNALHDKVMQRRFHADPRIRATEALLHEHIPSVISPGVADAREERPLPRVVPITGVTAERPHTPDTPTPKVQLLSNGRCSLMISNCGGGYTRWRDMDITRWRADTTCDAPGTACFIKDLDTGITWSTTHQPIRSPEQRYTWSFTPDKADFRRRSGRCDTIMEVAVSAEDDAEVRRVTLVNISRQSCSVELTSYAELALAPHAADRAHPAFNKLFIETEWLPEWHALLARRRPRSPHDQTVWVAHLIAMDAPPGELPQFETDRARFIGRGRTLENPMALDFPLSNRTEASLDPIFSLRYRVTIEPNQRCQFSLVTMVAESRETIMTLVHRYSEFRAAHRAFETAWTHAQLEMRRLHVQPGEVQLFQQLAAHVLYPQTQLRPPPARLGRGVGGQRALWSQGISGDLPIVAVTIASQGDIELVRQVLTAHTFWHLRGLKVDLVLISEEAPGYEEPLFEQLRRLAEAHAQITGLDQPGGIFLRSASKIPKEEMTVILAAARAVLIAARGTLRQQLAAPAPVSPLAPKLTPGRAIPEEPSAQLPFMELQFFNGLGGFTLDGKEYAIYLGPGAQTPLPWVNVIANPQFGTLVTESGSGFTWAGNSQSYRLTPWSNDPVSDPADSAIYIRDEDMGVFWSPTPLPIRELDAYRCRHGQGYSIFEHNSHAIEQELVVFVPLDDSGGQPVRVQRLRLRNRSSRRRRLTVTSYAGLVLGNDREETQLHILMKWDLQSSALFARNAYHPDFCHRTAFATSSPSPSSFSGNRTVFIGRNRSLSNPAAMEREKLSGGASPGMDPCAAVQTTLSIEAGEEAEVTFLLGQAANEFQARATVEKFRDPGNVEKALQETRDWWDRFLGTIEVKTPEPTADLMLNRWLLYQTLSCRIWGRSAFYQSGGAFGFRDQLQDVMALADVMPEIARAQILRTASRQFLEGDVQHWWHPESGAGVRTRISDDLLWLPFVTAHYVRATGDAAILDAVVPFLEAKPLDEGEMESFSVPAVSDTRASLLEHCRRAVVRATTAGPHGLPLIGCGDWNDGLNRVGIEGKGESIWLAWFLICVLNDFAELLDLHDEGDAAEEQRVQAKRLAKTVEAQAWDGGWYRRGYFDDGSPLGSIECAEGKIDSLAQSWAMISGAANLQRANQALLAVDEHLVRDAEKMILLFTPPFDKTPRDAGYIKGYPPGVRENGGQYTHAATWVAMASARKGDGERAVALLQMLNPAEHARTAEEVERYKVEPYTVAADVYALPGSVGRGGWTWYTGAAGWLYRVWLEEVLGFKLRGDSLIMDPVISKDWPEFTLRYRYRNTFYEIKVENPDRVNRGVRLVELDGLPLLTRVIPLRDDGQPHTVRCCLGPEMVTTVQESI